jgi:hypothetical protein
MTKLVRVHDASTLVERYQALEVEADLAEIPASQFRYEQCRIAHEATTGPGSLTQLDFGKQAGVTQQTISRQVRVWTEFHSVLSEDRPTYWDALRVVDNIKPEKEPAEPKEITVEDELRKLIEGVREHIALIIGFGTSPALEVIALQAAAEGHALYDYLASWGEGQKVGEKVRRYLADAAEVH